MEEATSLLDRSDFNLIHAMQLAKQSFVVTDPSLPDNPIVFASQGFLEITGYRMEQVLGRNCRFLQGPDTAHDKVSGWEGSGGQALGSWGDREGGMEGDVRVLVW